MMAIPELVDRRILRLVPHPFGISRWFIVW